MAIRFSCPSCRQPIEVDDNWGGQAVACPYCRRVVTAPQESDWPPGNVPVATPAGPAGFAPPPPPPGLTSPEQTWMGGYSPRRPAPGGVSSAGWALTLAIAAAILAIVGSLIWSVALVEMAARKVGHNAPQEQIQREAQQILLSGNAPQSPGAVTALALGILCGILAIALAVRSLVKHEDQFVKSIAACLIAALFVACQGMLVIVLLQQRAMAG